MIIIRSMRRRSTLLACVAAPALTLGIAGPVQAQALAGADSQAIQEVVVTAERRTSTDQKTAASLTVRSGTDLLQDGRFTLAQVLEDVPGVAYTPSVIVQGGNDTQGANVVIRGMSSNLSASGGASALSGIASTAVYTDGVYEGYGSQYDLERVEVLRGPQGTLYGRSATGGVLAFHTRNPSLGSFEGTASAEFGNYDLQHYSGALNIPIGDTLAVRFSADLHDQGEGFFNGKSGEREKTAARVKILWQPNDKLSVLVGAALEDNNNKFGGLTRTAPALGVVTSTTVPTTAGENHGQQVWAEIKYDLGWADLTYEPAFRNWREKDQQFVGLFNGSVLNQDIVTPYSRFWTNELRLTSNADDSPLSWQLGAFFYNNQLENHNIVHLAVGPIAFSSDGKKETNAWGVFGEGTYRFTDTTRLTLGVRYDYTHIQNPQSYTTNANFPCVSTNVPFPGCTGPGSPQTLLTLSQSASQTSAKFENFNYKARLEHDLTPQNLLYASVSTGFLPGDVGVVELGAGPGTYLAPNKVAPETLTAYELGSKNRFLNNTLQLNASVFFYDYGGFQTMYQVSPLVPTTTSVTVPAQNIGSELEALWQFTSNDRLGLTYSYVQSRYVRKPTAFAAVITQSTQAIVPQTFTASYDHTFDLPGGSTLRAGIDARGQSASTSQNLAIWDLQAGLGPYVRRSAMTIGDLTASWNSADSRYQISAYVRNFTDDHRILYSNVSSTGIGVTQPDPRQYGIVLSAGF